jgi:hypothetical protein
VVLDSTYPIYVFEFINLHSSAGSAILQMNGSSDSGSNYNITKMTSYFEFWHDEADSSTGVTYNTGNDMAQGTGFCDLQTEYGTDNDQAGCGNLWLWSPSNTSFVKYFIFKGNQYHQGDYNQGNRVVGYFNTTSAVDAIQFKMSSGNIDSGQIKLYGLGDS